MSPLPPEFADWSSPEERADVFERLGRDPDGWLPALRAIPSVETSQVYADALWRAWTAGGLEREARAPPWDERPARALHQLLAGVFRALRDETVPPRWHAFDDRTTSREPIAPDEALLRRWCWVEGWTLMAQDEDLLFSTDDAAPLLEEALAGCPKRDYAISIATREIHQAIEQLRHGRGVELSRYASAWPPLLDRIGTQGAALATKVRQLLAAKAR